MTFALKMPEFYIIIARKIFLFMNFRGHVPPPALRLLRLCKKSSRLACWLLWLWPYWGKLFRTEWIAPGTTGSRADRRASVSRRRWEVAVERTRSNEEGRSRPGSVPARWYALQSTVSAAASQPQRSATTDSVTDAVRCGPLQRLQRGLQVRHNGDEV